MSDWRAHITEEPEDSDRPSIKGTGVQVEAVLRLLSRIAAGDSHPERGIPLEELERELLHGLPEDDE